MGESGAVFENDNGVVLRITRRMKSREELDMKLLGDSFKIALRDS